MDARRAMGAVALGYLAFSFHLNQHKVAVLMPPSGQGMGHYAYLGLHWVILIIFGCMIVCTVAAKARIIIGLDCSDASNDALLCSMILPFLVVFELALTTDFDGFAWWKSLYCGGWHMSNALFVSLGCDFFESSFFGQKKIME